MEEIEKKVMIKITKETRQRLNVKKAQLGFKTTDALIVYLMIKEEEK